MTKVVGTNLAALICATEISGAGHHVAFSAEKGFAGHFRGIDFGNNREDLGMILLEPPRTESKAPIDEYAGESRAEAAKYADHFIDWLANRNIQFTDVEVLTLFRGELIEDYFIRDSLKVLDYLNASERDQIRTEIRQNQANNQSDDFHPSNKNTSPEFKNHNFRTAVANTAGETFFNVLFAPWLEKAYGDSSHELVAAEHRIAWMPLYYPETVVQALEGNRSLKEHVFLYPANSSFAQLISELEEQLRSSPFAVDLSNSSDLLSSDSDTDEAYFGKPENSPVAIPENFSEVYFENRFIPGKQILFETIVESSKTIFVADDAYLPIRVNTRSRSTRSEGKISIEFGDNSQGFSDSELISESLKLLGDLGIEVEDSTKCLVSTFAYPLRVISPNPRRYFSHLDKTKKVTGFPIGEFNSSMNDQAIAALHTARTIIKGEK